MIRRLIANRIRYWSEQVVEEGKLARFLSGSPVGGHAEKAWLRARRRYRFWDTVGDIMTREGDGHA